MEDLLIDKYLKEKGITIIGQYFSYDKNIYKNDIISQINLIIEFHKKLAGSDLTGISRIKSTIGKEVETYKVQIKRLNKHYKELSNNPYNNKVEAYILSNGKLMLNKAMKAIDYIYDHNYLAVIKRSMNRGEICLGKIDRNNLRINKGNIEIGITKGMAYNLIEEDIYNYIKRLQRKEILMEEEELINLFVHGSHLSFSSMEYLKGLINYPKDFLKTWERYKESNNSLYATKKKYKKEEDILIDLERSLKYETKEFI